MRPPRWGLGNEQRADDWGLAGQDKESDFTPSEVGSNCGFKQRSAMIELCFERITLFLLP